MFRTEHVYDKAEGRLLIDLKREKLMTVLLLRETGGITRRVKHDTSADIKEKRKRLHSHHFILDSLNIDAICYLP